jgi:hypothetical protein
MPTGWSLRNTTTQLMHWALIILSASITSVSASTVITGRLANIPMERCMKPPHSSSREMPHPAQAGVSPIIAIKTMAK